MFSPRSIEAFENHLKCNICKIRPKVGKSHWYRCLTLHQICQDCKEVKKLEKCSCGELISHEFDKMTEDWLNDETMNFNCQNESRGCQETLGGEAMVAHESDCIYKVVAPTEAKRPLDHVEEPTINPERQFKKFKGGKVCCAVGCHVSQGKDDASFFKVKNKRYPDRSEKWIRAISRDNPDGTPWQPSDFTVICSNHFVSGHPSTITSSPDYVPTIFPTNHRRPATKQDVERLNRVSE